jgi:hypothetical protein
MIEQERTTRALPIAVVATLLGTCPLAIEKLFALLFLPLIAEG